MILVTCSSWRLIYDRQVIYVVQTRTRSHAQKCLFLFSFQLSFFPLIFVFSMWLVHVNVLLSHISEKCLRLCFFFSQTQLSIVSDERTYDRAKNSLIVEKNVKIQKEKKLPPRFRLRIHYKLLLLCIERLCITVSQINYEKAPHRCSAYMCHNQIDHNLFFRLFLIFFLEFH